MFPLDRVSFIKAGSDRRMGLSFEFCLADRKAGASLAALPPVIGSLTLLPGALLLKQKR